MSNLRKGYEPVARPINYGSRSNVLDTVSLRRLLVASVLVWCLIPQLASAQNLIFWTQDDNSAEFPHLVSGSIWRSNETGGDLIEVVATAEQPKGIAVDPVDNKVYWSTSDLGQGYAIYRMNLDGSNIGPDHFLGAVSSRVFYRPHQ